MTWIAISCGVRRLANTHGIKLDEVYARGNEFSRNQQINRLHSYSIRTMWNATNTAVGRRVSAARIPGTKGCQRTLLFEPIGPYVLQRTIRRLLQVQGRRMDGTRPPFDKPESPSAAMACVANKPVVQHQVAQRPRLTLGGEARRR